jgi:hypothetical protein
MDPESGEEFDGANLRGGRFTCKTLSGEDREGER